MVCLQDCSALMIPYVSICYSCSEDYIIICTVLTPKNDNHWQWKRFNAEQNTSRVTSIGMLDYLEWNSLETCKNVAKVTMLYKITHNLVAINPDFYISSQTSLT